ncbi:MAG: CotH kinase family protein [Lachnospiraceae bacterium]|nr:CotH kinase family protein [Lachnospiraceae bacterium]
MKKYFKKIIVLTLSTAICVSPISYQTTIAKAEQQFTINELSSLIAPGKPYLYNFVDAQKGYQVSFTDNNDYSSVSDYELSYQVFINGSSAPVATVSKSGDYIDASLIDSLGLTVGRQYNVSYKVIANWSNGSTTVSPMSAVSTFYYSKGTACYDTGIPQVYVSTSRTTGYSGTANVNLYTDTSKTKVNTSVTVVTANGTTSTADFGTINVRGNSTAQAAKKPYNIKFNSKQNLFGMGKAKKWSLLANIFDKTLMRNKIGLDFQRSLEKTHTSNQVYTSECQPVDLYIDGRYLGNYLLTESVETGSSRVDIDTDYCDDNDNPGSSSTTVIVNNKTYQLYDILLELANDVINIPSRYDEETYYFKTGRLNEYFCANEPERTNTSYDYRAESTNKPIWITNTRDFLNDFESVITNNTLNSQIQFDLISQYIDVESFVDFYITSEFFMTKDINFSSTRFYIKNGKLYAGPLWDLDLSSGNSNEHTGYDDLYAQNFLWFKNLMQNSEFSNRVKNRYKELQPKIRQLYEPDGAIDRYYNTILKSAEKTYSVAFNGHDNTGWHLSTNYGAYNSPVTYNSYIAYVNEYRSWLENRNNWLLNEWDIDPDEIKISDDVKIIFYQLSTVKKAFRTLYSSEKNINGKEVIASGLVFAVEPSTNNSDLFVGSTNPNVISFYASDLGISPINYSNSSTATCYIMTMMFDSFGASELSRGMAVRSYSKLSDGSYVYSPVYKFSFYSVADFLYKNNRMSTFNAHNFLYDSILSVVNPSYEQVPFDFSNTLYK